MEVGVPGDSLAQWLARWQLEEYAERLAGLGYDLDVLAALNESETREMHEYIRSKPGHRVRFRQVSGGRKGTLTAQREF